MQRVIKSIVFEVSILIALFQFYSLRVIEVFDYLGYPDTLEFDARTIIGLLVALSVVFLPNRGVFFVISRWLVIYPLSIFFVYGGSVFVPLLTIWIFYFLLLSKISLYFDFFGTSFESRLGNILLLTMFAFALLMIVRYNHLLGFNFQDIYAKRSLAKEELQGIWSYCYHITLKGVIPALIVLAIDANRRGVAVILIIIGLLLASIFSQKSVISIYLLAALLMIFNKVKFVYIQLLAIIVLAISLGVDNVFVDAVVTRVFFDSSLIREGYWNYIQTPLFYSSSVLEGFVTYTYDIQPANLIGLKTFGDGNMNANIGFPSDTLMNLGIYSFIGFPTNIILFRLLEQISKSSLVAVVFCANFMFTRFSGEFFTVMLTHGLFMFLFITLKFKLR